MKCLAVQCSNQNPSGQKNIFKHRKNKPTQPSSTTHPSWLDDSFVCSAKQLTSNGKGWKDGWKITWVQRPKSTHKSMYDLLKINISSEACLPLDCSITWETSTYWYVWISQVSQSHIMKTCGFFSSSAFKKTNYSNDASCFNHVFKVFTP